MALLRQRSRQIATNAPTEKTVMMIRGNRWYYGASDRRAIIAALRAALDENERLRAELADREEERDVE